jgi:hypothetical protein
MARAASARHGAGIDISKPGMSAEMTGVTVTFFENFAAKTKSERTLTIQEVAALIPNARAQVKKQLPWLKLARFGNKRTKKASLRWDGNVDAVSGFVGDYDGERMSPETAVELLLKADIIALVYTSPSHTDEKPRWRVVCPFSCELSPDQHYQMAARINGALGGVLAAESFTLSQSYFFGAVGDNPAPRVILVDGTMHVDRCDNLDKNAIGKPKPNGKGANGADGTAHGWRGWLEQITEKDDARPQVQSAIACYIGEYGKGADLATLKLAIREALERNRPNHPPGWLDDRDEHLDAMITDMLAKQGDKPGRRIGRYPITGGVLCYRKWLPKGDYDDIPLSNFTARIVEDQILDDGAIRTRRYRIAGAFANSTPLPDAIVEAERFGGSAWIRSCWGSRAIVYPGAGTQFLEAAIQSNSTAVETEVFGHFGWRRIGGEWVYLHAGGGIGGIGPVPNVAVEVSGPLLRVVLPPVTDIRAAVRASLALVEISPLGAVLAAGAYRAPLGEISPNTLSLFPHGPTGSFKSALEGVAQAHWGSTFDGTTFPANFTDTENDLEMKSHRCKDMLFGVDEYKPRGLGRRALDELHRKGERLFRGQANQSGRGRLTSDLKERPNYYPRGLTIASGEDTPMGQSLQARMVLVPVKYGDIPRAKLTALQASASSGLMAQAMSAYVQWLAPQIDGLRTEFVHMRDAIQFGSIDAHARTPRNYADLIAGLRTFLAFAGDVGAITAAERNAIEAKATETIAAVLAAQSEEQSAEDEATVFLEGLGSALAHGKVYVEDFYNQGEPPYGREEECGWEAIPKPPVQDGGDGSVEPEERVIWRSASKNRVGWLREWKGQLQLCVLAQPAISAVEQLLRRDLGIGKNTLIRRLEEAEAVIKSNANVGAGVDGKDKKVLILKPERVLIGRG